MNMIKSACVLAVMLILIQGCAGFQLSSQTKDVTVDKTSPNTFIVNFCGNAYMTQKEVENFALQRAAEVAITEGCSHFLVLEKRDDSEVCLLKPKIASKQPESITTSTEREAVYDGFLPYVKPNVSLKIRCLKARERIPEEAIDAEKFLRENFPGLRD